MCYDTSGNEMAGRLAKKVCTEPDDELTYTSPYNQIQYSVIEYGPTSGPKSSAPTPLPRSCCALWGGQEGVRSGSGGGQVLNMWKPLHTLKPENTNHWARKKQLEDIVHKDPSSGFRKRGTMTELVKRAPPNNNNFIFGQSNSH
jgi:hypothetical protein